MQSPDRHGIDSPGRLSTPRTLSRASMASITLPLAAACVAALIGAPVAAQEYPREPIKLIVPFTAGGATDVAARMLAERIGPKVGQPIIVDNRPGASATVGASAVARAAPNGYTILFGSATVASWSLLPGANVSFDVLNDFALIGKVTGSDLIAVVQAKSKINDLKGLVDLMRTAPSTAQFGSAGIGSSGHLGGELLKQLTKTEALHVPYKGESAALTDMLGGQLTFMLCTPSSCAPRIRDGSLKGLALTSTTRSKSVPNIPTMAEAGVPGLVAGPWWYLAAPKGTPPAIIATWTTALNEVLADEKFRERLQGLGLKSESSTSPSAVRAELEEEMNKWRPVIKSAKISAE